MNFVATMLLWSTNQAFQYDLSSPKCNLLSWAPGNPESPIPYFTRNTWMFELSDLTVASERDERPTFPLEGSERTR